MRKDPKQLLKLLIYVLGRHPDEFGLVPDEGGFVRMKELVKAITEEPGWGYVRRQDLNEVFMVFRDHPFVVTDDLIRAIRADDGAFRTDAVIPPKLLYCCVRRKAYPVVCEKGIMPMGLSVVCLTTTEDLAQRMGKRRDPHPVLLTVQAFRAWQQGVVFSRQGSSVYLADYIPVGFFAGPPLPKEAKEQGAKEKKESPPPGAGAGSFFLDLNRSAGLQSQRDKKKGRKKEIAWKKEARKVRRRK